MTESTSVHNLMPGNRQYDCHDFTDIAGQHNVMLLVGNGFDIAVLKMLESTNGQSYDAAKSGGDSPVVSKSTSYTAFYDFIIASNSRSKHSREHEKLVKETNVLFQKMTELKQKNDEADPGDTTYENWSDFENIIEEFFVDKELAYGEQKQVEVDLTEIQQAFTAFLNDVVDTDVLNELDSLAQEHSWATRTYARFISDIHEEDFPRFHFPLNVNHKNLLNYTVINFNFTSLLDNYLYLDKVQFEPHPHWSSDANFWFYRNERGYFHYKPCILMNEKTFCSAYMMSQIYHPHGQQQIPRSLLFGVSGDDEAAKSGSHFQMEKAYWSQAPRNFEKKINETELFIVFGSSLGKSDHWWWRHILKALHDGAELIIYKWGKGDHASVSKKIRDDFVDQYFDERYFQSVNDDDGDVDVDFSAIKDELKERIFVVNYTDNTSISAFGFSKQPFTPGAKLQLFSPVEVK